MRYLLMIAMLSNISGCDDAVAEGPKTDPQEQDECGASGYVGMVGTSIAAITLPSSLNHRVIGPDTMVTYDYVPERINFHTDKNGIILSVSCG